MTSFFKKLTIPILITLGLTSQVHSQGQRDVDLLKEYFEMLVSGNLETAGYMWTQTAQERSSRFKISYKEIPIKLDCSSPVVRYLDEMSDYLTRPVSKKQILDDGFSKLTFSTIFLGKNVEHPYYLYHDGSYYWLTYSQEYYCREWPVVESKYMRVHYHPDVKKYLNSLILKEADSFIESLMKKIGIDQNDIEIIEEKKIEYFFCDSDMTVKRITGFLAKGIYDLASDDIISAFFPHYHEIAHLLIAIKLKEQSLYTLPIFREGISVYFGGRWGKMPETLAELAAVLLKHELISIDSILTMNDFKNNSGSDIAYPVAGLFNEFIYSNIPQEKYWQLYREFSGTFEKVNSLTADSIKLTLMNSLNLKSWQKLLENFNKFSREKISLYAEIMPGITEKSNELWSNDMVELSVRKDWVNLKFSHSSDRAVSGNLLFGKISNSETQLSSLFQEQYDTDTVREDYRFGIRYDRNEVGLYDYVTNHLVAKYIWGILPSDKYFDSTAKSISLRIKKNIFTDGLPQKENFKLLPK